MEGVGGKYLEECTEVVSSKISRDINLQKKLWKTTLLLLKPWLNENHSKLIQSITEI